MYVSFHQLITQRPLHPTSTCRSTTSEGRQKRVSMLQCQVIFSRYEIATTHIDAFDTRNPLTIAGESGNYFLGLPARKNRFYLSGRNRGRLWPVANFVQQTRKGRDFSLLKSKSSLNYYPDGRSLKLDAGALDTVGRSQELVLRARSCGFGEVFCGFFGLEFFFNYS